MGRKQAQALLAALIAWPLAAQTYEPVLLTPQIMGSPQTMTALNGGDDSTRQVQLGFPFEYYGQTFTSAWVSTNGFVSFQGPEHLCCNGFPMEEAQRNTIYAYWTDLISGGNPYYRTDSSSALFGWYNTFEYGTQNKNTFEINLSADGSIQFNYGALGNTFHLVSAGITGPTAADNIQLFYGQNVQNLQNQSGVLVLASAPEPVAPVPPAVDPAPDVAPDPTQPAQVDLVEAAPAQEAAQETAQEIELSPAEDVTVEEEAAADETVAEEAPARAEETQAVTGGEAPLTPDQVAALAAPATAAVEQPGETERDSAPRGEAETVSAQGGEAAPEKPSASQVEIEEDEPPRAALASSLGDFEQSSPQQSLTDEAPAQLEAPQSIGSDVAALDVPVAEAPRLTPLEQSGDAAQNRPAQNISEPPPSDSPSLSVADVAESAPKALLERAPTLADEAPAEGTSVADVRLSEAPQQPEQTQPTVDEVRRDRNVDFFQREAAEDADTFARETVAQATVQNVAFLAQADAQYAQQYGEQTTTETVAVTYDIGPVEGPTFGPAPVTGMATESEPVWTDGAPQPSFEQPAPSSFTGADANPAGQTQQIELLGLSMQREMSVDEPKDIGDVNNQDSEAMAQLSAVPPGYASYTQGRVPDAPFYQPRDIYKGRRIPDANLALYRMMSGQDARWNDMVEDQYER